MRLREKQQQGMDLGMGICLRATHLVLWGEEDFPNGHEGLTRVTALLPEKALPWAQSS